MKIAQTAIIVILLLAVIVVGYLLLNKGLNPSNTNQVQQTANPSYKTPSPSKISLEELRKIISDLGENPTPAAIEQNSVSVSNVAIDSPVLDVSSCVATPNVLHLKMNQSFTLQNKDSISHQINYALVSFNSAAKSQNETTLNFQSPGNYAFRCDESSQFAGVFLVTP